MNALRSLLLAEARIFLRDRMSLIFTALFPLLFIVIFGSLMSDFGSSGGARLGVLLSPDADLEVLGTVLDSLGNIEWRTFEPLDALDTAIEKRQIDLGIQWSGARIEFIYNAHRTQENYAYEEIARAIVSRLELAAQGASSVLAVKHESVGSGSEADWFTLVVPGILSFSILSAGLFAIAGHLSSMKERRLLSRYLVTPMRPSALLFAIAVVRLAVVFSSTLLTLAVAMLMFRLHYDIDWFRYILFIIASTLGTMGLGTVIARVVRQASSASNLASAISLVMMFVSGIYFPIEIMPAFLQKLSLAMPLRHMADVMRYVTGVMDMPDRDYWIILGAFVGLAFALFPLLARYVVTAEKH